MSNANKCDCLYAYIEWYETCGYDFVNPLIVGRKNNDKIINENPVMVWKSENRQIYGNQIDSFVT